MSPPTGRLRATSGGQEHQGQERDAEVERQVHGEEPRVEGDRVQHAARPKHAEQVEGVGADGVAKGQLRLASPGGEQARGELRRRGAHGDDGEPDDGLGDAQAKAMVEAPETSAFEPRISKAKPRPTAKSWASRRWPAPGRRALSTQSVAAAMVRPWLRGPGAPSPWGRPMARFAVMRIIDHGAPGLAELVGQLLFSGGARAVATQQQDHPHHEAEHQRHALHPPQAVAGAGEAPDQGVAKAAMGTSRLKVSFGAVRPKSAAGRPTATSRLKGFEPSTLPTAKAGAPLIAAKTETASSGAEVPKATTVRPITSGETPTRRARPVAPSMRESPPWARAARPRTMSAKERSISRPYPGPGGRSRPGGGSSSRWRGLAR
jgi:hypothetical protein